MIWVLFAMLGIILLAGLVVLYVAYPHRGEEVPNAPWVGAVSYTHLTLPTTSRV